MADYKEMYLKLFRATEKAISCLIAAQQECEELYINSYDTQIKEPPSASSCNNVPFEQDEVHLTNKQ